MSAFVLRYTGTLLRRRPLASNLSTKRRSLSVQNGPQTKDSYYRTNRVNAMVGHNFPDYIEWWNRDNFYKVGYGLVAVTSVCAVVGSTVATMTVSSLAPAVVLGTLTAGYWHLGLEDIRQTSHAIRRNYPVLGNLRYILEMVRYYLSTCVAVFLVSHSFHVGVSI
jgi:hypothetical protein